MSGSPLGGVAAPGGNTVGFDTLYGIPVDGDRTESGGGAAAALAQPRCYGNLTLSNSTSLSMAGYRLHVADTLTVGAGCALHNDGSPAAAEVFGAAAPSGELAVLGLAGRPGGDPTGNGAACYTDPRVVGGNAGAGGAGFGTGGTTSAQSISTATYGTQWSVLALEYLCSLKALNLTQYVGGVGGAGGGGGNAGFKYGGAGGGGGGLAWIRAKKIVNNGRISCRGGAGGLPTSGGNGGGGGGGGGGVLAIWCDEWTGNPPDCNGGAGGAGDGSGASGSTGGNGKVLVFVKGKLKFRSGFGASAPDLNNL